MRQIVLTALILALAGLFGPFPGPAAAAKEAAGKKAASSTVKLRIEGMT